MVDGVLSDLQINDVVHATIRQSVAVAQKLEEQTGEPFIHLEFGIPGLPACRYGVEAQIEALRGGIASVYPNIAGCADLKQAGSRFVKAFLNLDVAPEGIVPTVGSMQGSYNLMLEASQLTQGKDTILFINPGFPVQRQQTRILGIKSEAFDIYDYRADRLRDKLEEYLQKGNIAAMIYSNPNNPAWICLTEDELRIIGECATKYDAIVIEDLAYMGMDFRQDLGTPGEPPYQATVARYTDNYVLMLSGSKIFSYAGERIAVMAFSDKLYRREYDELRRRYNIARCGDAFVLTYLYANSSGTAHSAQIALAAMMNAAVEGRYNFVHETAEYARRAARTKEIFVRNGFHIVYDRDMDQPVSDGFFYTVGRHGLTDEQLIKRLLRCGIVAIALVTTGSNQNGLRVCVSRINTDSEFEELDRRLQLFNTLTD